MARSKISFSLEIFNPDQNLKFFLTFGPSGNFHPIARSAGNSSFLRGRPSGKGKAHKHKLIFPVTARVGGGGLPTGWPGVSRPVARGQRFMCCVRNPRNINICVREPGREDSGTRPGGSVTGVTEKVFMCHLCAFSGP